MLNDEELTVCKALGKAPAQFNVNKPVSLLFSRAEFALFQPRILEYIAQFNKIPIMPLTNGK